MSLRKIPQVTPEVAAANRGNAQNSTGPRTSAGKDHSRLNALKHGLYTAAQNEPAVMSALGEDPAQFEASRQELLASYGPGDELWNRQLDDLAKLYWRRTRLERAQGALVHRSRLELEARERQRDTDLAAAHFDLSELDIPDIEPPASGDACVRLRKILSALEIIRHYSARHTFRPRYYACVEKLYRGRMLPRVRRIARLLRAFADPTMIWARQEEDQELKRMIEADCGPPDPAGEAELAELQSLLKEEMVAVKEEYACAEQLHTEEVAVARDLCLVPADPAWDSLLRQEAVLDRAIDRKVRILMQMRRDYRRERSQEARAPSEGVGARPSASGVGAPAPGPAPDSRRAERNEWLEPESDTPQTAREEVVNTKTNGTKPECL
jgi:hypothetical protein